MPGAEGDNASPKWVRSPVLDEWASLPREEFRGTEQEVKTGIRVE